LLAAALGWQAAQFAGVVTLEERKSAAETSSCSCRNQRVVVIRGSPSAARALPRPHRSQELPISPLLRVDGGVNPEAAIDRAHQDQEVPAGVLGRTSRVGRIQAAQLHSFPCVDEERRPAPPKAVNPGTSLRRSPVLGLQLPGVGPSSRVAGRRDGKRVRGAADAKHPLLIDVD
jgi:hypothetical protein